MVLAGYIGAYIDSVAWVGVFEGTRDKGCWRWRCATATGYADLGAFNVELKRAISFAGKEYKPARKYLT